MMIVRSAPLLAAALLAAPAQAQDAPAAAQPLPTLDSAGAAPVAPPAPQPAPTPAQAPLPANAGYTAAQRAAWLDQCRAPRYPGGVVPAGQPDVCETYLQQFERNYTQAVQRLANGQGAYATPAGAAGEEAVGGAGSVMWVQVPFRQPAAARPAAVAQPADETQPVASAEPPGEAGPPPADEPAANGSD